MERVHPLHDHLCVGLIQDPFVFILAKKYGNRPNNNEEISQNVFGFLANFGFPSKYLDFGTPPGCTPHMHMKGNILMYISVFKFSRYINI